MCHSVKCAICGIKIKIPDTEDEILQYEDQIRQLMAHKETCKGRFGVVA